MMHCCNQTLEDTICLFFLFKLLIGSHISEIDYLAIFVIDVEIHHFHYDCRLVTLSFFFVTFCTHLVYLSSFVSFFLALVKLKNFFQRKVLLGYQGVRNASLIKTWAPKLLIHASINSFLDFFKAHIIDKGIWIYLVFLKCFYQVYTEQIFCSVVCV